MAATDSSPQGAYIQLKDLLDLRFRRLKLSHTPRQAQSSVMAGSYRTSIRGRGIDFAEVRQYQAGDDVRAIDWRVTARTGTTHTKLYTEERERPVMIFCDQRYNMFFGSTIRFKAVQAANLASLLAWSYQANGDRVGGLVANSVEHKEFRPKQNNLAVLRLLNAIHQCNQQLNAKVQPKNIISLNLLIASLRRIAKPGSAVYLISDFIDFDDDTAKQLSLLSRHCDVQALCITDPLEKSLPKSGNYKVVNLGRSARVNAGNTHNRSVYEGKFIERQQALEKSLYELNINLLQVSTEDDPHDVLHRYLAASPKKIRS
ncbi:MAG: hypothetical protein ACJA0M_001653 [Chitinophagales bacterium]|jgi:uncharacterized protein (DUF58 family)